MGRFLFKAAIISILCLLAYLLFRVVINIVMEDYLDGRFDRSTKTVERTISRADYSAEISDLTIEHNQIKDDEYGMFVYSTQTWHNLKGITCYSVLRFFNDQGKPLQGKRYRDDDGDFCITGTLVSEGNKCENDQRIFVPYSEFDVTSGTVHFLCDMCLYTFDNEGNTIDLAYSKPSRFHISSK